MNVLVVGRGGREHSIVMKLVESSMVTKVYAAPGNGGMEGHATCIPIAETDIDRLIDFVKNNSIDFTIVGPETPLDLGIANRFQAEGLPIFAPTKEAALLEGSKSFAKEFMKRHHIPTAEYQTFTDAEKAKQYIDEKGAPIVVKADGLAAGKGVVVAETKEEAFDAIDAMLVSKVFAEAGTKIVVEEFLDGEEFSLMAFVHHERVYPMITARDYKRAFNNDEGPNTGGMGAYAPVPDVSEEILSFTTKEILERTAEGLVEEGRSFTGILYAGWIMTDNGTQVFEFNTRFADPETKVVLPLLNNYLLRVMLDVMNGVDPHLEWDTDSCVGVVLAAKGYPGKNCKKNIAIPPLEEADGAFTLFPGTKHTEDGLVSDGGRVLLVGGKNACIKKATKVAYLPLKGLPADAEFFYRNDIGYSER